MWVNLIGFWKDGLVVCDRLFRIVYPSAVIKKTVLRPVLSRNAGKGKLVRLGGFIIGEVVIEIVQRSVARIPWRSNITLLNKLSDPELRL